MDPYDSSCRLCPLHEEAHSVCIRPRGNIVAPRILFVGEAPKGEEDSLGRVFVGPAGRILKTAIEECGIENYALTMAVRCRPPGDRNPYAAELKACRTYLDSELDRWKPQIVVPMGNVALKAITGKSGITKYAGVRLDDPRFIVFPMISPAALLRPGGAGDRTAKFTADMAALAALARGDGGRPRYDVLNVEEAIDWIDSVAEYDGTDWFTIDLETSDLNPRHGKIVTVALHAAGDTVWAEWSDRLASPLYRLLTSGKTMVAHNATFELKWLLHYVFAKGRSSSHLRQVRWPVHDTLLFHHLLDENSAHDLSHLSKLHTPIGGYDDEVVAMKLAGTKHHEIAPAVLGNYNAGDAHATAYLYEEFLPAVKADFWPLWTDIVEPAIWAITHAEYYGRKIDLDAASSLNDELKEVEDDAFDLMMTDPRVHSWEDEWHAGLIPDVKKPLPERRDKEGLIVRERERFNPGSSQQLADLLQRKVGVTLKGTTDSGAPSVKENWLRPYAESKPFVGAYLRWKEARTLRNNYLGEVRSADNPEGAGVLRYVRRDGFLYGSYLLHGTATGRLASSSPNLQNFAPRLRTIAVSRWPDGWILEADFSQLELRLIAWASGCEALLEAYRRGEDVHRLTAQRVLEMGYGIKKSLDEVTPEERQDKGKRVNFGLTYGAFPKRIASEWQIPLNEAKTIYDAYHAAYPEIGRYVRRQQKIAERKGLLTSFFGRHRRLPEAQVNVDDWGDPRKKAKIHALLAASNFGIQSLASDLNTWAFCQVVEALAGNGMDSLGIGLTHDSGAYDCAAREVDVVAGMVRQTMVEGVALVFPEITVPMEVDVKIGRTWGDLKTYDHSLALQA